MYFDLEDLGYTQDTIDLVNRSVMACFHFWGQPGFALIGTGRSVHSIATGVKLGDSILFCESPSTNSNYTIYSVTTNQFFGYRNESSFSNSWNNVIFPSMLNYFNSSTMNSSAWTIYMTFDEGRIFYVNGSDTNTVVFTYNNVSAYDIKFGETVNITSTLKLGDGTLLANKNITFNVDGLETNITTNEYGIAEYQYTPTHIGLFNVSTHFAGDEYYYNSSANTSFNVGKRNTSLSLTAANITYGDNASINATLTDSNGSVLSNKNITFSINNGIDFNVTTNGLGVAVLNRSGLPAGVYNVSASFDGDDDYNPSNNNTIFSVAKMDTSLVINKTVNANNVYVGDLIRYTINVKNIGSNPVTSIKVNDTLPGLLEFVSSDSNNSGSDSIPYLWNIPLLSSGESATLNIVCKVKEPGIIKNTASLIINNYENNLTNSSSVDITAANCIPPLPPAINGTDGDGSDGGGDGLPLSTVPLLALVLSIIGGVYYYRKK
ncbi:MAG: conserved hypothetical protein partial [Methanobrevibacter sp. CfCl-M3]